MPRSTPRCPAKLLAALALVVALLTQAGCDASDPARLARRHLDHSQALLAQGQYRAALIEVDQAIRQQPGDPRGHLMLARLHNQLGHPDRALRTLEQAPSSPSPELALERAEALLQLRRHRAAHDILAAILDQVEGETGYRWQLLQALALAGSGQPETARQLLRELLELHNLPRARIELARLELAADRFSQAVELLQPLSPEQAEYPEAQQLLGLAAYRQGDLDQAAARFAHALSALPATDPLLPLQTGLLQQLTRILVEQGHSDEVLADQQQLGAAAPGRGIQQALDEAVAWYRAGHPGEAEALLIALYATPPVDVRDTLFPGLAHYYQVDPAATGRLFDLYAAAGAPSPKLTAAATSASRLPRHIQEALNLLKQALAEQPDHSGLLALYGMLSLHSPDRQDEAILALQRALALTPERSLLRLPLASHFLQASKPAQALAQLQAAAVDAPISAPLQQTYIALLLAQNRPAQARRAAQRYLEVSGQTVAARVLLAEVAVHLDDYEAAQEQLELALQADPGSLSANEARGQLALRQQDWELAADHFYRAIQLAPDSAQAYLGLIAAYEAPGKGLQVDALLAELAEHPEHAATAYGVRADQALHQGRLPAARHALHRALRHGSPTPYTAQVGARLYRTEARLAWEKGDLHRARDRFLAALELLPGDRCTLSELVEMEALAGHPEAAEQMVQLLHQQLDDTGADLLEAWLLWQQGHPEAARALLEQAWQQRADAAVAESLHRLLSAIGAQQPAQELAWDWSRRQPEDHRPLVLLAVNAHQAGSPRQAQRHYEEALGLAPDDPWLLLQLARLYLELGHPRADELAQRAMAQAPSHAETVSASGWILLQGEQRTEGLALLRRAAIMAPDSPTIHDRLRQARQSIGVPP